MPGQRAGDLRHLAGELERLDELGARRAVGEDVEVGVAGAHGALSSRAAPRRTHEAERHEHGGEGMGDHAVAPVVVADAAGPVDEDVALGCRSLWSRLGGSGEAARLLAPAAHRPLHRGDPAQRRRVAPAHGLQRLAEARRPSPTGRMSGDAEGEHRVDLRLELALQPAVLARSRPTQVRPALARQRRAAVGQQDPAARRIARRSASARGPGTARASSP